MPRSKIYENINTYIDQWQKEHYAIISIKLNKEDIARIRAYADFFGPNISRFVFNACTEYAKQMRNSYFDDKRANMDKHIESFVEEFLQKKSSKKIDTQADINTLHIKV